VPESTLSRNEKNAPLASTDPFARSPALRTAMNVEPTRLEAAQRVFEHELIHLAEMLVFGRSSCAAEPFRELAWGWFGHTETKHDLVTQQERARAKFDVRVGDRVTFTFEGTPYTGVVNRITRRATVLVEDARGQAYSDGKRYLKFYIPLTMLQRASP
jgi:hypothetical protein